MANWRDVWGARELSDDFGAGAEPLELALRLDGYDTTMAQGLTPRAMRDLAAGWGNRVGWVAGDSVYEVGCGAGAFLAAVSDVHGPRQLGGSDYSRSLIESGHRLFPSMDLEVHEARHVPSEPPYTHVTSVGAFMYFPDLDYAAAVVARMMAKASRTVSILDVPDVSVRAKSEEFRRRGHTDSEYEERYEGLDHLYFAREWFLGQFDGHEWRVLLVDQAVDGYSNSDFRFNVFAQRRVTH